MAPEKKHTYPKSERLKSKTAIELMFREGRSVSKYPLRLAYVESPEFKIGVSVSKKYFKRAVDRNYFKRVLREAYRLNKQALHENFQKPYSFMLLYQTKDRLSFEEINQKTIQLFEKFLHHIKPKEEE